MLQFFFQRHLVLLAFALLALLASLGSSVDGALSLPAKADKTGPRANAIAATQTKIQNEPRTIPVGDQVVPFYMGPIPRPGSMAEQLRYKEVSLVQTHTNDVAQFMAMLVYSQSQQQKLTSVEAIAGIYELGTTKIEKPMSVDNSDANFGRQRMTHKAMKLRQVRLNEYADKPFSLTDTQLAETCGKGVTWDNIRSLRRLYVDDFGDVAQWNDPKTVDVKYAPNVVGFFCYNDERRVLLPIEIRYPDTGLAYTARDSPEEWTLAKMGLNAASFNYHQFHHMAEIHAVMIPVRVELYRHMSAEHPIRALLERHMLVDIGLEMLLHSVLLTPNTAMDKTFGWGAIGSARFLDNQTQKVVSFKNSLPADLEARGLNDIPVHPYAIYGRRLYEDINRFVQRYVNAYYKNNAAVLTDFELQSWAKACSEVPQLRGFMSSFKARSQVQAALTHLIFQGAVKHHAMNGQATWHSSGAPYSMAALWKKMPTRKVQVGEKLNLMEYVAPALRIQDFVGLVSLFSRSVPASETLSQAYRAAPFNTEPLLTSAITDFERDLLKTDAFMVANEKNETWPFLVLRPTQTAFYSWV